MKSSSLYTYAGGELTLLDSSAEGNGGINYSHGSVGYPLISSHGNVYVYGGNYISNSTAGCTVWIYKESTASTIYGGTFIAENWGTTVYIEGNLIVEEGTFKAAENNGNALEISSQGSAKINGGEFIAINGAALTNEGSTIVNDGYFYSERRGKAGYCIDSDNYIEIHGGEVHGIQGGIAINGGSAVITDCDVWVEDVVYARGEDTTNKAYYALYVAGESDKTHSVIISGGTYRSSGAAVVLVGNDTQSGGVREEAYCSIYGGTFLSLGTISVNDKPSGKTTPIFSDSGATLGTAVIYGGTYNKDISVYSFLDIVKAPVNNGDGTWTVNSGISAPVN